MGGYLLEDVLCACEGGGRGCVWERGEGGCVWERGEGGGVWERGGDRCLKFIKVLAIALNTILPLRVHKAFQLSCILSDPRKHHTAVVPACSLTSRNHEAE